MDHRPEEAAHSAGLSQRLIDDSTLHASLAAVAEAGRSLIQQCASASVTIVEDGVPATVASTDGTALALDEVQYRSGDGPCLTAAQSEEVVAVSAMAEDDRWPQLTAAAAERGIGSCVSLPLALPGDTTYGGLNLYGEAARAFDGGDRRVAEVVAAQASLVVAQAVAYWAALEHSRHLTQAMENRAEIEQAKGIIMAAQRCGADEAFDILRRASQRENRKLRDIAADVVARATESDPT